MTSRLRGCRRAARVAIPASLLVAAGLHAVGCRYDRPTQYFGAPAAPASGDPEMFSLYEAADRLDTVARHLEEWGSMSMSAPLASVSGDHFEFKLNKDADDFYDANRLGGASSTRRLEVLLAGLNAAVRLIDAPDVSSGGGDDASGEQIEEGSDDSSDEDPADAGPPDPGEPSTKAATDAIETLRKTIEDIAGTFTRPPREGIRLAASDVYERGLHTFLSTANDGGQLTDGVRVVYLTFSVSCQPGWRSRQGYIGRLDARLRYQFDVSTHLGRLMSQAAQLDGAASVVSPLDGAEDRLQPMVVAVYPSFDSQELDLVTQERRLRAAALQLQAIGATKAANAALDLARQDERDSRTRSALTRLSSFSNGGPHFGFEFRPEFFADADPADKRPDAARILEPITMPAVAIVAIREAELNEWLVADVIDQATRLAKGDEPQHAALFDTITAEAVRLAGSDYANLRKPFRQALRDLAATEPERIREVVAMVSADDLVSPASAADATEDPEILAFAGTVYPDFDTTEDFATARLAASTIHETQLTMAGALMALQKVSQADALRSIIAALKKASVANGHVGLEADLVQSWQRLDTPQPASRAPLGAPAPAYEFERAELRRSLARARHLVSGWGRYETDAVRARDAFRRDFRVIERARASTQTDRSDAEQTKLDQAIYVTRHFDKLRALRTGEGPAYMGRWIDALEDQWKSTSASKKLAENKCQKVSGEDLADVENIYWQLESLFKLVHTDGADRAVRRDLAARAAELSRRLSMHRPFVAIAKPTASKQPKPPAIANVAPTVFAPAVAGAGPRTVRIQLTNMPKDRGSPAVSLLGAEGRFRAELASATPDSGVAIVHIKPTPEAAGAGAAQHRFVAVELRWPGAKADDRSEDRSEDIALVTPLIELNRPAQARLSITRDGRGRITSIQFTPSDADDPAGEIREILKVLPDHPPAARATSRGAGAGG